MNCCDIIGKRKFKRVLPSDEIVHCVAAGALTDRLVYLTGQTRSMAMAIPCPTPTHMVHSARRPPLRAS